MRFILGALVCCLSLIGAMAQEKAPVQFIVYGLAHDHARGFIPLARGRTDAQLVGIIETNLELVARYAKAYNLPTNMFHASLEACLKQTNAQAAAIFSSAFDHKKVVEECAAKKLHVMMEKPFAVSMDHARAMERAVKKAGVELIVNYETTWYASNHAAYELVHGEKAIGDLRKIVVHDGHRGPVEIGCSKEFLAWLTDPVLNGGGALTDFGCYGADLITWLMKGERPTSVFATTQTIKPDVYPKVDDEANIVVTYPKAVGVIQGSWNWPIDRKDMELYGQTGQIMAPRNNLLRIQKRGSGAEEKTPKALEGAKADPLSYLAAVVRGEMKPEGLSSLEVNLIATEILDAARKSAKTGKRVDLK